MLMAGQEMGIIFLHLSKTTTLWELQIPEWARLVLLLVKQEEAL
jgi:hypothetical protein